MNEITLIVKQKANNKDFLKTIEKEGFENISIKVEIEEPNRQPTLSQSPLGEYIAPEALEHIRQLLNADSMTRLAIQSIWQGVVWETFKIFFNKIKPFLLLNNKQKGNAWGAKMEITHKISTDLIQTYNFFLDSIPEEFLSEAVSNSLDKIKQFRDTVGKEYADKLKIIGFTYNQEDRDWNVLGVEMFDGVIEIPEEKEEGEEV